VTILVPRGAESAAVRRARPNARVIDVPAAARAATDLPPFEDDETVVVLGLCGALRGASVGDVVVYRRVIGDAASFEPDPGLRDALARRSPPTSSMRAPPTTSSPGGPNVRCSHPATARTSSTWRERIWPPHSPRVPCDSRWSAS
jgi:hypothetical protein